MLSILLSQLTPAQVFVLFPTRSNQETSSKRYHARINFCQHLSTIDWFLFISCCSLLDPTKRLARSDTMHGSTFVNNLSTIGWFLFIDGRCVYRRSTNPKMRPSPKQIHIWNRKLSRWENLKNLQVFPARIHEQISPKLCILDLLDLGWAVLGLGKRHET